MTKEMEKELARIEESGLTPAQVAEAQIMAAVREYLRAMGEKIGPYDVCPMCGSAAGSRG